MGLENPNVIDVMTRPEPGKLELIITDAGLTTDPAERRAKLIAKLRVYVNYLLSEQFATDHPDVDLDDVSIRVVCSTPPTAEMLAIGTVRPRVEPPRAFTVRFVLFADGKMTPMLPETEVPDREKILPRLVLPSFLERVPAGTELAHRELGETGLLVAYVEDGEHAVRFIMAELFEALGLSEYQLYELALENLADSGDLEPIVRRTLEEQSITALKFLDTYDAARLLLVPACLRPGESVVALVPDRDTLTLLPPPNDDGWEPVRELAKVPGSEHLLLPRPILVTSEGFEVR